MSQRKGASVEVHLTKEPAAFQGVPAHQLDILNRMQVPVFAPGNQELTSNPVGADLIVDGMIGYSLSGAPRGQVADNIRWANAQSAPKLALDSNFKVFHFRQLMRLFLCDTQQDFY